MNSRFRKSFLALAFLMFGITRITFAQLAPPGLPSPQAGPSASQSGIIEWLVERPNAIAAAPQTQSKFVGSVPRKFVPGVLPVSLEDAIERGLKQNLGALFSNQDVPAARGSPLATVERTAAARNRGVR